MLYQANGGGDTLRSCFARTLAMVATVVVQEINLSSLEVALSMRAPSPPSIAVSFQAVGALSLPYDTR